MRVTQTQPPPERAAELDALALEVCGGDRSRAAELVTEVLARAADAEEARRIILEHRERAAAVRRIAAWKALQRRPWLTPVAVAFAVGLFLGGALSALRLEAEPIEAAEVPDLPAETETDVPRATESRQAAQLLQAIAPPEPLALAPLQEPVAGDRFTFHLAARSVVVVHFDGKLLQPVVDGRQVIRDAVLEAGSHELRFVSPAPEPAPATSVWFEAIDAASLNLESARARLAAADLTNDYQAWRAYHEARLALAVLKGEPDAEYTDLWRRETMAQAHLDTLCATLVAHDDRAGLRELFPNPDQRCYYLGR